tara:strand:- start:439 stop:876 length:438 start_codon:yes stop_codon:yes gene_type:complete
MSISTILFVCTGNTCRSPLAEGIAQKWLDDHNCKEWLAVSAGVYATEGAPTSLETIEALLTKGIVFDGISLPVTLDMVEAATAIYCMSTSHLASLENLTDKAELLDPNGDISDPIGQDQSVYDALADQMEKLISTKLKMLTNKGA